MCDAAAVACKKCLRETIDVSLHPSRLAIER
jgi:hypothetical protein